MLQNRLSELRARRALANANIAIAGTLDPIESVTNEVWAAGDVVLRVNRRLHSRLRREAEVAELLAPEVPYPRIVAVGKGGGDDWVAVERVPGVPLVRCWPSLSREQRQQAVAELAWILQRVHATEVPEELAGAEDPPQLLQPGAHATEPLLAAIERARGMDHVDRGVLEELRGYVRTKRGVLDPFESTRLIHGDLHFQNVLWDGSHVAALLDLEFARPAPSDLDLDVFLRFCAYPALFVPEGREHEARREDYDEVPDWLRLEYPALFEHPDLVERLRIYSIAFDMKALLASPPRGPLNSLTHRHPYRRLMATVRHESHLDHLARR
jgi:aminoglycoside phosphotransferase (APT) family kinase protein